MLLDHLTTCLFEATRELLRIELLNHDVGVLCIVVRSRLASLRCWLRLILDLLHLDPTGLGIGVLSPNLFMDHPMLRLLTTGGQDRFLRMLRDFILFFTFSDLNAIIVVSPALLVID